MTLNAESATPDGVPSAVASAKPAKEAPAPTAEQIGRKYKAGAAAYQACGALLKAKKAALGHGKWEPWLKENEAVLGFGKRTAERLMKWADTPAMNPDDVWGNAPAKEAPAACAETDNEAKASSTSDLAPADAPREPDHAHPALVSAFVKAIKECAADWGLDEIQAAFAEALQEARPAPEMQKEAA
jgi:hypothetical protein